MSRPILQVSSSRDTGKDAAEMEGLRPSKPPHESLSVSVSDIGFPWARS